MSTPSTDDLLLPCSRPFKKPRSSVCCSKQLHVRIGSAVCVGEVVYERGVDNCRAEKRLWLEVAVEPAVMLEPADLPVENPPSPRLGVGDVS